MKLSIEAGAIRSILESRVVHWTALVEYYERVGARDKLPFARAALRQCREFLGKSGGE